MGIFYVKQQSYLFHTCRLNEVMATWIEHLKSFISKMTIEKRHKVLHKSKTTESERTVQT